VCMYLYVCMCLCVHVYPRVYVFSSVPGWFRWGVLFQDLSLSLQGCTRATVSPQNAQGTHCVHQVNEVEIASFDGRAHMAAADDNGEVSH
jgi:hypothetical protein